MIVFAPVLFPPTEARTGQFMESGNEWSRAGIVDLVVGFHEGFDRTRPVQDAGAADASVRHLDVLPFALVRGTTEVFARLELDRAVIGFEPNLPLELTMSSARRATRVDDVHLGRIQVPGEFSGQSNPVHAHDESRNDTAHRASASGASGTARAFSGTGVGIAIVDTGVDCTHPDLADACVPGRNLLCAATTDASYFFGPGPVRCTTYVASNNTDDQGHGTHVAGIAVGSGKLSNGLHRGVAPGADLYAYGHTVGGSFDAYAAWDHILAHPSEPGHAPIRIVSNSWKPGGDPLTPEAPPSEFFKLAVRKMVESGFVMTFANGNAGGGDTGDDYDSEKSQQWSPACVIRDHLGQPLQGLLCVGAYADGNLGSAEGAVTLTSSNGRPSLPATWPDLVAPGADIMSTCALHCTPPRTGGGYALQDGTSMSTPFVAGVVAVMLEANPTLTPAGVEAILKKTAFGFSGFAPYPNHHAGHGLVDALAAVQTAMEMDSSPVTDELRFNVVKYAATLCSGHVGTWVPETASWDKCGAGMLPSQGTFGVGAGIAPGATAVEVVGFVTFNVGTLALHGTPTSHILGPANVVADLHFEGSNRTKSVDFAFVEGVLPGPHYRSGPIPYVWPNDGPIKATLSFDLRADDVFDPILDGFAVVRATPSP